MEEGSSIGGLPRRRCGFQTYLKSEKRVTNLLGEIEKEVLVQWSWISKGEEQERGGKFHSGFPLSEKFLKLMRIRGTNVHFERRS